MIRPWWLCVLLAGLVISAASAKTGVVQTKNGARFEGDVKEEDDKVTVVTRSGVVSTVARDNVASVEYLASFEDQFKQKLGKLGPKDVAGRVGLARWAFDNRKYILARETLEAAVAIDPNNTDANALLETVRGQIRLERAPTAMTPEPTAVEVAKGGAAGTADRTVLSAAQINEVWQKDFRAKDLDAKAVVRFENNVQRRFVDAEGREIAPFTMLPPAQRAEQILTRGDSRMKEDVKIATAPSAIKEFRTLWPIIASGCATSNCHGSSAGKGFVLVVPADNDAAITTNFYLLEKYSKSIMTPLKSGGSAAMERTMLDRNNPGRSLLFQYGMKRDLAEIAHPAVEGYNPVFMSGEDRRYQKIKAWMGGTLRSIRPDYSFVFPAGSAAAVKPATQPATAPTTAPATEPVILVPAK